MRAWSTENVLRFHPMFGSIGKPSRPVRRWLAGVYRQQFRVKSGNYHLEDRISEKVYSVGKFNELDENTVFRREVECAEAGTVVGRILTIPHLTGARETAALRRPPLPTWATSAAGLVPAKRGCWSSCLLTTASDH